MSGRRGGVGAVVVRALALVGIAALAGAAHSLTRATPIRLVRPAGGAAVPATPTDPGESGPSAAAPDPGPAYDAERVASLSGGALLDEPVLPGMITLGEAHALFEQGSAFIDARHREEYEAGHVPGAIWMPASEVYERAGELMMFDPTAPVVIYCEGGTCDSSHNTANRIEMASEQMQLGIADLRIMGLGFEEWARAGLPVETGGDP